MDSIRDAMEDANEISAALSQSLTNDAGLDDEELMNELDELQQQELDAQMLEFDTKTKTKGIIIKRKYI